jgi:hypothetical protein
VPMAGEPSARPLPDLSSGVHFPTAVGWLALLGGRVLPRYCLDVSLANWAARYNKSTRSVPLNLCYSSTLNFCGRRPSVSLATASIICSSFGCLRHFVQKTRRQSFYTAQTAHCQLWKTTVRWKVGYGRHVHGGQASQSSCPP